MNNQNRAADRPVASQPVEKQPYLKPALTKHGKVDSLTQQSNGGNPISPPLTSL